MTRLPVRLWHRLTDLSDTFFALCAASASAARRGLALGPRTRRARRRRSDQSSVPLDVERLETRWLMTAVAFSASTYSVNENAGTLTVTVSLDTHPPTTAPATYATANGSA